MIIHSNKNTRDEKEINSFNLNAIDWWNINGQYNLLHKLTACRMEYIIETIKRNNSNRNFKNNKEVCNGLKVLDIGCGGGLLCEPLTRLGANVLGVDAAPEAINIAKNHAELMGLSIKYECKTVEEVSSAERKFDLVIASEVIEHVSNRSIFLNSIANISKANTSIIITTINQSFSGILFGKFAAEYLLKLVPPGTHDWSKFVSPENLFKEAKTAGIILDNFTGIVPNLINKEFFLGPFLGINYASSGMLA